MNVEFMRVVVVVAKLLLSLVDWSFKLDLYVFYW
jgi:hypothetical protein